jgi:outer membrane lipoprotein-sorting protein
MGRAYGNLSSLEQESDNTMEIDSGGRKNRNTVKIRFLYQKPNRFLYHVADAEGGVTVASDGQRAGVYSRSLGKYMEMTAPGDIRQAPDTLGEWARTYMDAFAFLQGASPYKEVTSIRRIGAAKLGGVPVDVLELRGTPKEYQMPNSVTRLYIGQKDRLLLKSITEATRPDHPSSPVPGTAPGRLSIRMTKTHRIISIDRPLPAARFAFEPPAGAQRVSRLPR